MEKRLDHGSRETARTARIFIWEKVHFVALEYALWHRLSIIRDVNFYMIRQWRLGIIDNLIQYQIHIFL